MIWWCSALQSLEEILSQAILDFSTALDELRRGVFSQASNMLAHLIPNDDFLSYTLDFASEYVEERVDIALTGDIQQAAIEYLNKVLKANLYKTLGPFNGALSEKVVHKMFVDEECVRFTRVNQLKDSGPVSITNFRPLRHNRVKFFDDCSAVNDKWKNYCCRPRNKNNASFDSFVVVDNTIYLFQMTIQGCHDLKAVGLTNLTKTCPLIKILGRKLKIKFYFVVPSDRFLLYKTKVSVGGQVQFEYEDKMEQFVVQINFLMFFVMLLSVHMHRKHTVVVLFVF